MGADVQKFKNVVIGANTDLSRADINGTFTRTYSADAANGTAGTAVTESLIEHVRRAGTVKSITVTAPIAVAVDATNNATVSVWKRTGAGAATLIGSVPTTTAGVGAGGLAAFVPYTLTAAQITAANTQVADGDVLTYGIAKGGTGVALSAATSFFKVSVDVEEGV